MVYKGQVSMEMGYKKQRKFDFISYNKSLLRTSIKITAKEGMLKFKYSFLLHQPVPP